MKILHIFDFFSPSGGGTVDVIYRLAKAQAQQGHDVSLYTSDYKLDRAYINSLPEVKVSLFHCVSAIGGFYFVPGFISGLKNGIREFDVVHLHCFRSFQNIVVHHYTAKYHVPYVMDSHGSLPRVAAGETSPKWLLRWFFDVCAGDRLLTDAAVIVAQNNFAVRENLKFGVREDKIAVIPLFFPVEDFSRLPPRGVFRRKYGLESWKIVMSLGRLHRIKGLDFLIEAFHELAASEKDAVLVIVGPDDGYLESLKRLVSSLDLNNRVVFTGFLGGDDKLAALEDADVMVQPSRYEQAAWAPVEAILCGTPVIVSRQSGAGEDIARMNAGRLVDYGNREQMIESIREVLDDPAPAREKTTKAADYIRRNLSLTRKVEDYDSLYLRCLEANKISRRN